MDGSIMRGKRKQGPTKINSPLGIRFMIYSLSFHILQSERHKIGLKTANLQLSEGPLTL